jgi:hypothetical protein
MTTHLRGLETTFLSFNRGDDGISNLELVSHRDPCASFLSKSQPPCLQCDRPARSRGLCTRHYRQFRTKDTASADIPLVYILVGDFY